MEKQGLDYETRIGSKTKSPVASVQEKFTHHRFFCDFLLKNWTDFFRDPMILLELFVRPTWTRF